MTTVYERTFRTQYLEQKNFPVFKQPQIRGYFSIDKDRKLQFDTSNLQYYHGGTRLPKHQTISLNLDIGTDKAIKKPEFLKEIEQINHLLYYLKYNTEIHLNQELNIKKFFSFDFVAFRGLCTMILCSPYEKNEGWAINATYFKGNIYLCDTITDQKRQNILNANEKQKKCSSWGYKFEQYLLTSDPKIPPDSSKPVCEAEEFCCIFETKINNIQLLYGAEMDGVLSDSKINVNSANDLNNAKFVELKTNRVIDNERQYQNYLRYKYIKWWCQSFLVGINDILIGFRNDQGRVLNLKHLEVNNIPKQVMGQWSPSVCMNFLKEMLDLISFVIKNDTALNDDDPHTVWQFVLKPQALHVEVKKYCGQSDLSFIPDWFVNHVRSFKKINNEVI